MKKMIILQKMLFVLLCFSVAAYAQVVRVGINKTSPKATPDIKAKTTNGTQAEGLIAPLPRLTGDEIKARDTNYGTAEKGTIIYATAAVTKASTKTAAITAPGYYYFDGAKWQSVANAKKAGVGKAGTDHRLP